MPYFYPKKMSPIHKLVSNRKNSTKITSPQVGKYKRLSQALLERPKSRRVMMKNECHDHPFIAGASLSLISLKFPRTSLVLSRHKVKWITSQPNSSTNKI